MMNLQKEKSFRILSLDAKDIYAQNLHNPQVGVFIDVDYKSEDYDVREYFLNTLDWSLETDKLIEVYEEKENKKFYRVDRFGTKFTEAVINVTFQHKFAEEGVEEKDTFALRDSLYKNGFLYNKKRYVRYKRSSGSSRDGNCLFILKSLKKAMDEWSNCGLSFDENNHDLASWEAYRALSLSSIIGILHIPVERILFVEDYKSIFESEVVEVYTKDGTLETERKKAQIENDIWDGEALLDESLFQGDFKDKHMLLLRNRFFKTCAFKTRLQKWFKDNNATIETVRKTGVTLAKSIDDIVMVTTPNSLKYLKFLNGGLTTENIQQWANNVNEEFGIVKYDKRTHFFHGEKVQTSYQLLNTLPLTQGEVEKVLLPSREYLGLVRSDMAVLHYHLSEAFRGEGSYGVSEEDEELIGKNQVVWKLLETNALISKTKVFIDFRDRMVAAFKKNLKRGHLLFSGTNATLFGNGPELLMATIGLFDGGQPKSILPMGTVQCKKFEDGEELLGARSPHVTMGNLFLIKNQVRGGIWDYFDLGENIVCVNAIEDNIQHRLNGCDYDSDTMLLTNNARLVESAKSGYAQFYVPVLRKPEQNVSEEKVNDLIVLDKRISVNKIGEIINFAQRLNSIYWERKHRGEKDGQEELYQDICKLAVLSGIEIDKAKRDFPVESDKVLKELRKKYNDELVSRPNFFKIIDEESIEKYHQETKKERNYDFLHTAMDYVVAGVENMKFSKGRQKKSVYIKVTDLFDKVAIERNDRNKKKKILEILEDLNQKIIVLQKKKIYASETEKSLIGELIQSKKEEAAEKLRGICNTRGVTYLMIQTLDEMSEGKGEKNYPSLLFELLFHPKNELVYAMIKKQETLEYLQKGPQGAIELFGIKFEKILKNLS